MTAPEPVKRLLVGRPLRSQQLHETLLPKWLALPVFCSDPISSVAYATEEIVLVLAAGGAAYLALAKWVAAAVAALLVIVVASYRQTCYAYPNGGGAFAVSLDNFGENAALTAAAALLVDYVMTVAVSVVSGVVAHHQRRRRACTATRSQLSVGLHRGADAGQPARRAGVRAGLRGPDLRLRRADLPDVRSSARSRASPGSCPTRATATQQLQRTAARRRRSSRCCSSCARSPPAAPR